MNLIKSHQQSKIFISFATGPRNSPVILLAAIISILLTSAASAAVLSASADRLSITVDESLVLTVQLDEQSFLNSPDFSVLEKDFQIVDNSQSSRINMINGSMTSLTQWNLTLIPKKVGKLTIPAITMGSLKTNPITINVNPASRSRSTSANNEIIFLESSVDKTSVYVQAQLTYIIKLFYRTENITDWTLSEPSLADAIVKELGEPKQYHEYVDGVRYGVLERRYAIFPQSDGILTIPPIAFNGVVANQNTRLRFNFSRGKRVIKRSQEVVVSVKPIPDNYPNQPWLPAKNLTLTESWSPKQKAFKVGEPSTRTITITATGLGSAMIPPLPAINNQNLKAYPDQPSLEDDTSTDQLIGKRTESSAIIPTKAGDLNLPKLSIYWWNTETDQLEKSSLEQQNAIIQAGENISANIQTTTATGTGVDQEALTKLEQQVNQLEESLITWKIIGAVLLLLIAALTATIIILFRKQQTANLPLEISEEDPLDQLMPLSKAKAELIKKIETSNPSAIKTALIHWARSYYKNPKINSLGEIKELTESRDFIKSITRLEKNLYAKTSVNNWDARDIGQAIKELPKIPKFKFGNGKELPSLYPNYSN